MLCGVCRGYGHIRGCECKACNGTGMESNIGDNVDCDHYDVTIVCHGCDSKCKAGFNKEILIEIGPPECDDCSVSDCSCEAPMVKHYQSAQITEYMDALKSCSKLGSS